MAETIVSPQITDSVSQVNTLNVGVAPATAMGNLFQATTQALGNASHNAAFNQQQNTITAQTATTMGVTMLYSIDTASSTVGTTQIYGS